MPVLRLNDKLMFQPMPIPWEHEFQYRPMVEVGGLLRSAGPWQDVPGGTTPNRMQCFDVYVELPDDALGYVRARGVNAAGPGEWSNAIVVPEPDFVFTVFVATIFLGAIIHECARPSRRPRGMWAVRERRQRRPLRRRLRKVLRRGVWLVGGRR